MKRVPRASVCGESSVSSAGVMFAFVPVACFLPEEPQDPPAPMAEIIAGRFSLLFAPAFVGTAERRFGEGQQVRPGSGVIVGGHFTEDRQLEPPCQHGVLTGR